MHSVADSGRTECPVFQVIFIGSATAPSFFGEPESQAYYWNRGEQWLVRVFSIWVRVFSMWMVMILFTFEHKHMHIFVLVAYRHAQRLHVPLPVRNHVDDISKLSCAGRRLPCFGNRPPTGVTIAVNGLSSESAGTFLVRQPCLHEKVGDMLFSYAFCTIIFSHDAS
jgi:hypothetical protein